MLSAIARPRDRRSPPSAPGSQPWQKAPDAEEPRPNGLESPTSCCAIQADATPSRAARNCGPTIWLLRVGVVADQARRAPADPQHPLWRDHDRVRADPAWLISASVTALGERHPPSSLMPSGPRAWYSPAEVGQAIHESQRSTSYPGPLRRPRESL